jgi:hypothetical protein
MYFSKKRMIELNFQALIKLVAISISCLPASVVAEETPNEVSNKEQIHQETKDRGKTSLLFTPEISSMKLNGLSFFGMGAGITLNHQTRPNLLVSGTFRQEFSRKDIGKSIFTSFDIGFMYAPWGYRMPSKTVLTSKSTEFVTIDSAYSGGFFLTGGLKQYFFDLTKGVESFSGFGVGAAYDFFSISGANVGIAGDVDRITNGKNIIVMYRAMMRLGIFI